MAQKTKANCCPNCNETHEQCAGKKICPKWEISKHVCDIFGTCPEMKRRTTK